MAISWLECTEDFLCDIEWCPRLCDLRRLAPQDYHRFHAPVGGELVSIAHAGADLYSVKVFF